MSKTLVLELVAFAVFWLMTPSIAPEAKLLGCAAGFLVGAGYILLTLALSQKPFWSPLARLWVLLLFLSFLKGHLFSEVAVLGGCVMGMFFILSGSVRGRKSPPGKGPLTEVSPPQ